MKNMKRLTVCLLLAAMLISIFAGTVLTADQSTGDDYSEATELLSVLGFMTDDEQAWTNPITPAEANRVVQDLLYTPVGYGWTFNTFAGFGAAAIADDETVTGERLLRNAFASLNYGAFDENWEQFFHLKKGLSEYAEGEALTREQAAQILLNVLKCTPQYVTGASGLYTTIKANDPGLGLELVRTADTDGRPSYQWYRNGAALTSIYDDTPVATLTGDTVWGDLMDACGLTQTLANNAKHGFFRWSENGGDFTPYVLHYHGDGSDAAAFKDADWTLEIYDSYAIGLEAGAYHTKAYDVLCLKEDTPDDGTSSYPEATELLSALGMMTNEQQSWKAKITPAEANQVVLDLLYTPVGYGWTYETFAGYGAAAIADGETVTADRLLHNAFASMNYGALDANWTQFFHLKKGLTSYKDGTALTREQAAQLLLNVLRCTPQYVINYGAYARYTTRKADALGLELVRTTDAAGRPSYQWFRDGAALTGIYADTPVATLAGDATWGMILDNCGLNTALAGSGRHGGYRWSETGDAYELRYHGQECEGQAFGEADTTLEIYDSYGLSRYAEGFYTKDYDIVTRKGDAPTAGNTQWTGSGAAKITTNQPMNALQTILVNGEPLDSANYTLDEVDGKLVITFAEMWLHTLNNGVYSLSLVFDDGTAAAELTIKVRQPVTTDYPEAVELVSALGLMDEENADWKQALTGAEANAALDKFYAVFDNPVFTRFDDAGTVTGDALRGRLLGSIGWDYNNNEIWSGYNHLQRGMKDGFRVADAITREQAAQLMLNTLKAIPTYNPDTIKANDSTFGGGTIGGLQLVKTGEDEKGRPSYKWQRNGADLTQSYADSPVKVMSGGASWSDILTAIGDIGDYNCPAFFSTSQDGEAFSEYTYRQHPDYGRLLSSGWTLEIYSDYSVEHKLTGFEQFTWGYGYRIVCLNTGSSGGTTGGGGHAGGSKAASGGGAAKIEADTLYKEAVQLVCALGIMDASNADWKQLITPEEANRVLQALYNAPGFVASWKPGYTQSDTVTGDSFMSKALVTVAWNYGNDPVFSVYNHLPKGLAKDYSGDKALTREQAAQIVLNTMKTIPTYNIESIKAHDGGFASGEIGGLKLVQTGEDEKHRPIYQWQRKGVELTDSFADTPVMTMRGGATWSDIMTAVGDIGDANIAAFFSYSVDGGDFTPYVERIHPDYDVLLDRSWKLEVYADYDWTHRPTKSEHTSGLGYKIVCTQEAGGEDYSAGGAIGGTSGGGASVLSAAQKTALTVDTAYPEAVQLMMSTGLMDGGNADWQQKLSAAEANRVLQALYDAPGFEAPWSPGYGAGDTVTGTSFLSKAIVTIGWNYNNDGLFTAYNHLTRGLSSDYSTADALTREQAAQIVLNTLKSIPTYNADTLKAEDPGLQLRLVKTGTDADGRPSYKWQLGGADLTDSYPDTPVVTLEGGATWSDILSAVGDVGDINLPASFCWAENGGEVSAYAEKTHPDYESFMDVEWKLEIYSDYSTAHNGLGYTILCLPNDAAEEGHVHIRGEEEREIVTPAGCETDGVSETVIRCSVCGEIVSTEQETIPATGHDWVEAERVEPTGTQAGYIRYVCRNDESHTKTEELAAEEAAKSGMSTALKIVLGVVAVGVLAGGGYALFGRKRRYSKTGK